MEDMTYNRDKYHIYKYTNFAASLYNASSATSTCDSLFQTLHLLWAYQIKSYIHVTVYRLHTKPEVCTYYDYTRLIEALPWSQGWKASYQPAIGKFKPVIVHNYANSLVLSYGKFLVA